MPTLRAISLSTSSYKALEAALMYDAKYPNTPQPIAEYILHREYQLTSCLANIASGKHNFAGSPADYATRCLSQHLKSYAPISLTDAAKAVIDAATEINPIHLEKAIHNLKTALALQSSDD